MLQEKIIAKARNRTDEIKTGRYWATVVSAECPVEMYRRFMEGLGPDEDSILRMARGTAIHRGLEEYFDMTEIHFEIPESDFLITGKIDGIIDGHIYEIKTYSTLKYTPLEIYKNQVEIYLRAMQYDPVLIETISPWITCWDKAILGLIHMSSFKEKAIEVRLSDARWERILKNTRILHKALKSGSPPKCSCGKHR